MRRATIFRLALGVSSPLIVGCASTSLSQSAEPAGGAASAGDRATTLTVRNHNGLDVRIYIAVPGGGHRLGIVPKAGVGTFTLPRAISFPIQLQFVAVPLGNDDPQASPPVLVDAGDKLVLTLEPAASLSTLTKRP